MSPELREQKTHFTGSIESDPIDLESIGSDSNDLRL